MTHTTAIPTGKRCKKQDLAKATFAGTLLNKLLGRNYGDQEVHTYTWTQCPLCFSSFLVATIAFLLPYRFAVTHLDTGTQNINQLSGGTTQPEAIQAPNPTALRSVLY